MSFKDIVGQDRAVALLRSAISSDKVSHAYLFTGPEGVGKALTAIEFAKALNCRGDEGRRPCGECAQCRKISSGNHPDVLLIRPDKEGGSIGIDQVRRLIQEISLRPYEGRRKVYIIDGAQYMTQEASNAVLKTLEEPPADSVQILIADGKKRLLPTIVSRAQAVRFFALGTDEVKRLLVHERKIDPEHASLLARLASGSPGQALRYQREDFFEKRSRAIRALVDGTFFDSDFEGVSRNDMKILLDIALSWYRDILIAKSARLSDDRLIVNADKTSEISREAKRLGLEYLDGMIRQIISTSSFLEQSANPKLAMGVLALKSLEEN